MIIHLLSGFLILLLIFFSVIGYLFSKERIYVWLILVSSILLISIIFNTKKEFEE